LKITHGMMGSGGGAPAGSR